MSLRLLRTLSLLLPLVYLSACTGMRGPEAPASSPEFVAATPPEGMATPPADASPQPLVPEQPAAPPANPAVIALLDHAHAEANAGRLPLAVASIERALRIAPRDPVLWQELARLKLQKGDYQQAENFAARANSWAGSDKALQAANWRIISEARSLKGDNAGARTALEKAKDLEADLQKANMPGIAPLTE